MKFYRNIGLVAIVIKDKAVGAKSLCNLREWWHRVNGFVIPNVTLHTEFNKDNIKVYCRSGNVHKLCFKYGMYWRLECGWFKLQC